MFGVPSFFRSDPVLVTRYFLQDWVTFSMEEFKENSTVSSNSPSIFFIGVQTIESNDIFSWTEIKSRGEDAWGFSAIPSVTYTSTGVEGLGDEGNWFYPVPISQGSTFQNSLPGIFYLMPTVQEEKSEGLELGRVGGRVNTLGGFTQIVTTYVLNPL